MENTITFNQLDNSEMFKHCIIEVSTDKLNQNSEILDSILEYMYFDLEMRELQKYITKDGNFEIDFSMMNTICMTYRINIKVSSSFFNFEINPPSDTPITKHYKFPSDDDEDELIPMTKKEIEDWDRMLEIPCLLKDESQTWKEGEKEKITDELMSIIIPLHNEWSNLKYPPKKI